MLTGTIRSKNPAGLTFLRLQAIIVLTVAAALLLAGCKTRLDRAREFRAKGEWDQAVEFYKQVVKEDPANEEAIRELTEVYCDKKKNSFNCYDKVKPLFAKYPKDPRVKRWYKWSLMAKADALFKEMRLKAAMGRLKEYLKLEPESAVAYFKLGNALQRINLKRMRISEVHQSIEYFRAAIKRAKKGQIVAIFSTKDKVPLAWAAWMGIGRLSELQLPGEIKEPDDAPEPQKKLVEQGIHAFSQALKARPNYWLSPFQMAMFYARYKKDYKKAIENLEIAKKLSPNMPSVWCNMKMIYDKLAEDADGSEKKEYEKKGQDHDAKCASLRGKK